MSSSTVGAPCDIRCHAQRLQVVFLDESDDTSFCFLEHARRYRGKVLRKERPHEEGFLYLGHSFLSMHRCTSVDQFRKFMPLVGSNEHIVAPPPSVVTAPPHPAPVLSLHSGPEDRCSRTKALNTRVTVKCCRAPITGFALQVHCTCQRPWRELWSPTPLLWPTVLSRSCSLGLQSAGARRRRRS